MKKKEKELKEQISKSIEKTMSVIEKICPYDNVCLGIKVRDTYHSTGEIPKFSMFTASEMLWAITSPHLYSKAHYLTIGLLNAVNTELNGTYFDKQDRAFEKAFILLGTTSAGQSVSASVYLNTINSILSDQKEDGSWGCYSSGSSDVRATALCLIALASCYQYVGTGKNAQEPFSRIEAAILQSSKWLMGMFTNEGYCKRRISNFEVCSDQYTYGIELTAWSTYALILAAKCLDISSKTDRMITIINKSIRWLCQLEPKTIAEMPETEIEEYKKDKTLDTIVRHEYGAGGLDITIITLVAYRQSSFYNYIKCFDNTLEELVKNLLKHENENGEWWDKNSDSYGKAWTISYALKALSVYDDYLRNNEVFAGEAKQRFRATVSYLGTWINKYKIAIAIIIITILIMIFRQEIETRISFFNSPIAAAVGIVLSAISVYQGRKKD